MEIYNVVHALREKQLEQALEIASLRSQINMLERFTWNMLVQLKAGNDPTVDLVWDLESNVVSTVDSTVDSPERTDDAEPTLF